MSVTVVLGYEFASLCECIDEIGTHIRLPKEKPEFVCEFLSERRRFGARNLRVKISSEIEAVGRRREPPFSRTLADADPSSPKLPTFLILWPHQPDPMWSSGDF
jgi:hypothetical protein